MKRKTTVQDEKTIRRMFFYEHITPEAICKQFQVSQSTLRKIVGGPLRIERKTLELAYC